MEMEDQYGIADLRQLISRAAVAGPQFPPYAPPPPDLFCAQPHPHHHHQQYEMVVMGRHVTSEVPDMFNHTQARANSTTGMFHHHHQHQDNHHQLNNGDSTTTTTTTTGGSGGLDGGDGGSARWPRQETLTLLEIRSRLHHKFKEANQKGPLWDEVARIMSEEHGYQRSGKKCREKFENLYKYYKKTKEGKAGRQDGKHYRFFRQLEALYGASTSEDTHIPQNAPPFHHKSISSQTMNTYPPLHSQPPRGLCDTSVSLSNSTDFDPTSSDDEDDDIRDLNCQDTGEPSMESNGSREGRVRKKKGKRSNWKGKIKEFIDSQMRKVMEKQEAWLEKMMTTLEGREQERLMREEEWWRRQEAARVEREHKFWETERAWIEARDSALMKALEKLTHGSSSNGGCGFAGVDQWPEPEITRLIQLRTNMESRLQQCGISEEVLWEDIATKMAYFGYERSAIVCKEKWDSINKEFLEKDHCRKRKEDYNNYGVSNLNGGGSYMNQLNGFNNCEL
uniref:Myb-like domain-containing protein n=1 Tax=Opuntia streptacantha TaxID=393608 RepID=A0A7C8YL96_OPUST